MKLSDATRADAEEVWAHIKSRDSDGDCREWIQTIVGALGAGGADPAAVYAALRESVRATREHRRVELEHRAARPIADHQRRIVAQLDQAIKSIEEWHAVVRGPANRNRHPGPNVATPRVLEALREMFPPDLVEFEEDDADLESLRAIRDGYNRSPIPLSPTNPKATTDFERRKTTLGPPRLKQAPREMLAQAGVDRDQITALLRAVETGRAPGDDDE